MRLSCWFCGFIYVLHKNEKTTKKIDNVRNEMNTIACSFRWGRVGSYSEIDLKVSTVVHQ